MLGDEGSANSQPQPGALAGRFRREEGIKDPLLLAERNAHARILESEEYLTVLRSGADGEGTTTRHGLNGIQREIGNNLCHMASIDEDRGYIIGVCLDESDVGRTRRVLDEAQAVPHGVIEIEQLTVRRPGTAVIENLHHDLLRSLDLLLDALADLALFALVHGPFEQEGIVHMDGGERVVQLVSDLGGELTEGRKPLRADDLVVEGAQLLELSLELLVEARVLDRERGALEESRERLVVLGSEWRVACASNDDDSQLPHIAGNRRGANADEIADLGRDGRQVAGQLGRTHGTGGG